MPRKNQTNIESLKSEPEQEQMLSPRIMPEALFKPEKPKQKIHVVGFILLGLVVGAAVGAVYYWPEYGLRDFTNFDLDPRVYFTGKKASDVNNSEPKTYSNATYGFEFQYPASGTVSGDFEKDKTISIQSNDPRAQLLNIAYLNKTITQIRGEIATSYEGQIKSAKDIKFNGYNAREIIYDEGGMTGEVRIILIAQGNNTFRITHPLEGYADILATFKFTN